MATYSTLPRQSSPAPSPAHQTVSEQSRPEPTKEAFEEDRARSPSNLAQRRPSPIEWWVDWTLKIIGVTAAVLFGIWAPLSWKSTEDGNGTQSSMASALSAASTQGSQALYQASQVLILQSSLATVQSAMLSKLDAIGRLQVASFCLEQPSAKACAGIDANGLVSSVVSTLVPATSTATGGGRTSSSILTSSAVATATPSAIPSNSDSAPNGSGPGSLPLGAVLGIVAGVLLLLGIVTGIFLYRQRFRHR